MRDTVSASNEGEGAECRLALFFSSLLRNPDREIIKHLQQTPSNR